MSRLLEAVIGFFFRRFRCRRWVTENGYVQTISKSGQYQLEHRMVAEIVLGRRLRPWEVVHHINGRRHDNRIENLCVLHNRDHQRYHDWYDWIVQTYGNYPRRETQIRKLRESFRARLLVD